MANATRACRAQCKGHGGNGIRNISVYQQIFICKNYSCECVEAGKNKAYKKIYIYICELFTE